MLELDHISKSFGSTMAVDDISLSISPGEVVGLLGPNGAGKTTTMRLMSGFLLPDSGKVMVEGFDLFSHSREAQKAIGYLPENNPLYGELLVEEFLQYSAQLHSLTAQQFRLALKRVIPAVGLESVVYRPIRQLSKGFRQRVGLAAAMIHDPSVLILDEPTEGLDPNQRTELRSLLTSLAKDRTLIISTHVLQEVTAICDRIVILNQGKLVADGTPASLSASEKGRVRVVLSGSKVLSNLKKQPTLQLLSHRALDNSRFELTLAPAKSTQQVQPILTKLVVQNDWVIWSLSPETANLESIFQTLTEVKP